MGFSDQFSVPLVRRHESPYVHRPNVLQSVGEVLSFESLMKSLADIQNGAFTSAPDTIYMDGFTFWRMERLLDLGSRFGDRIPMRLRWKEKRLRREYLKSVVYNQPYEPDEDDESDNNDESNVNNPNP